MLADHPNSTVLLIDDQSIAYDMVDSMLQSHGDIRFHYVDDARQALAAAASLQPTVVLLDLKMPGVDGFDIMRQFREHPQTDHIPIIVLSVEDEPALKMRSFAEGANDYLVKWPDRLELVARIRCHSLAYHAQQQRDLAFDSLRRSQQELLARTRELAESQAALHHAQKMEAVGKLTGGVAHDFNNVLQIISGNLQLLKADTAGNANAHRRIQAAADGVARGARLSAQLLAFARRQPLHPLVICPGTLVRSMDELLRHALGEAITIRTAIADGLWNTLADPNQLENVILNLAFNARDAIEQQGQGTLSIDLQNATLGKDYAQAHIGVEPGEYVLVTMSDDGAGMAQDVRERAFEPFFTTKPRGQGTGLGLSMAYGFVKQSGGHIDLQSEPGQGTTVKIYLPRAVEAVMPQPNVQHGAISGGDHTILVVEDEPQVRSATAELLAGLGYRILQAEDAQQALQLVQSGAAVDLIFTDVVMPGTLSSTELAERARELLPGVRVLFASGYTEMRMIQDGKFDPRYNLLSKPYSGDALARKIQQMLQHQQPRTAAAAAATATTSEAQLRRT